MNDITILINSCDSYEDAWSLFFRILEKVWPEAKKYKIYLNTEEKTYQDSYFDIEVLNILPEKSRNIGWGERLCDCLDRIQSEIVLFLLEDFFFECAVDDSKIRNLVDWMRDDKQVAAISLISVYDVEEKYSIQKSKHGYILRKKNVHYTLNASPTLYRKNVLREFTRCKDNPWEWEFFGSIRTWFYKGDFYAKAPETESIFVYDIKHGGAIHRGKWVGCSTKEILKKYGLNADLEKRGVIEDWIISNPEKPQRTLFTIARNKFLYIKNVFIAMYMGFRLNRRDY